MARRVRELNAAISRKREQRMEFRTSFNKHTRRSTLHFLPIVAAALFGISVLGCSEDSVSPIANTLIAPASLTVRPSAGQSNVRLDAAVTLSFAKAVDRTVVERSVHLISERLMANSLCPDTSMMPHGGMFNVMMDSSMIRHMTQTHATLGRFTWNGDTTKCYFRPDSMMTPRTQYMIHMGPELMQMMRDRMAEIGTMSGHGFGTMRNDMMSHFVTMDTSGAGGGHHGH